MINIQKPTIDPKEVFETCISNFREPLKSRLEQITSIIENASIHYDTRALANRLYSFPTSSNINGTIDVDEMIKVYDKKLVPKNQPGRKYYDKLKLSSKNNKCSLCGLRTVSGLDHVLPKTQYPPFAVTPINLIPACSDCNKIKDTYIPTSHETEILHPYYDNITEEQYVFATVIEGTPASLNFYIKTSEPETIIEKRLKKQFELLELNELYTTHVGEELSNIHYKLSKLFESGGSDSVKEHLIEEFESRFVNNKNSWQTAMYKALHENDWFCTTGFNLDIE